MIDTRVLQVGVRVPHGRVDRIETRLLSLAVRVLRRLVGRETVADGKLMGASDRELASLGAMTSERMFDAGKAHATALRLGVSGGWLS